MSSTPSLQATPLLRRLIDAGVDFVVIGGVAVFLQGYPRLTKDLDIVYATNAANLERLGEVLAELGARLRGIDDDVPFAPDARTLKRTTILTLDTPLGSIDLLVDPAGADRYEAMRDRADIVALDGVEFRVVSVDDLLSMKRAAGRPQDIADIDALLTAQRVRRRVESGER
ncbi:MAG: nucleotidyl transferase AbiEii/AbiGii toxin family protein [Actinobacteria bacterium]|nr:nucleotidyl transferase AbiEii/AbiGii toxin family protein [Actinomycetota bacterium]